MLYACAGYRFLERALGCTKESSKRFNVHMAREEFAKSTVPEASCDALDLLIGGSARKRVREGFKYTSMEAEERIIKTMQHLKPFLARDWQDGDSDAR